MALTVLGCSGSYPSPDTPCSGYLLDDGRTRVWIDCGSGTLANVQRHVSLDQIDALIVSHSHPDHWLDLAVLRTALVYYMDRPPLPLFAPRETVDAAAALIGGLAPPFEPIVVASGDDLVIGSMRFRFLRTDHPVETLAMRIDEIDLSSLGGEDPVDSSQAGAGRSSLLYTSDTGPGFDPTPLGGDVSVVLSEATLSDAEEDHVHLSGAQAGRLAELCGASRLLLTHLAPDIDARTQVLAASECFDGPIEAVVTNERYEI